MKIKLFPIATVIMTVVSVLHLIFGHADRALVVAVVAVAFAVLATTED